MRIQFYDKIAGMITSAIHSYKLLKSSQERIIDSLRMEVEHLRVERQHHLDRIEKLEYQHTQLFNQHHESTIKHLDIISNLIGKQVPAADTVSSHSKTQQFRTHEQFVKAMEEDLVGSDLVNSIRDEWVRRTANRIQNLEDDVLGGAIH